MNLPELKFDYSLLDAETVSFLKEKEGVMRSQIREFVPKLGQVLKSAQDELAKRGYGCFEEWYQSLGFTKRSVYNYLNAYSFVQKMHEHNVEVPEELPSTLMYEAGKKSAHPDAVKAVADGNVATTKEFKELEMSLRAAEKEAAAAKKIAEQAEEAQQQAIQQQEELQQQLETLKKKKGRSKEDQSELDRLQKELQQLEQANRTLQQEIMERNASEENDRANLRKMKEALNKTRAYVDVDLSSALMYFTSIAEHREAQEYAARFWVELEETIARNRAKWDQALQNPVIEEVGGNAAGVIDIK